MADTTTIFRTVAQAAQADGKAAYFRLHRYRFAAVLRAVQAALPAGSHILEVGTTPGHFTQLLVAAGYRVSGVDLDPEKRRELWQRLGAEVKQANIEQEPLPFGDGLFDGVVFSEVIEHLVYSPLPVLREFHRVLRPGGVAIVSTPNDLYLKARLRMLLRILAWQSLHTKSEFAHQMRLEGTARYTTHARTYTLGELEWVLREAGFAAVHGEYSAAWEPVGLEKGRLLRAPHRVLPKLFFAGLADLIPPARSMLLAVGTK